MYVLLSRHEAPSVRLHWLSDDGTAVAEPTIVPMDALPDAVRVAEEDHPRWLWADTGAWYPALLAAGVRVQRCHDLRLSRAILRRSTLCRETIVATSPLDSWDERPPVGDSAPVRNSHTGTMVALFEDTLTETTAGPPVDEVAEFRRQQQ